MFFSATSWISSHLTFPPSSANLYGVILTLKESVSALDGGWTSHSDAWPFDLSGRNGAMSLVRMYASQAY